MYSAISESGPFNAILFTPSPARQAQTLATRGYTAAEAIKLREISSLEARKQYLKQNMETMVNHVFEDSAVSFTNYYQMNKGHVVSYPDGTLLHIDPDERGGLNEFGITSAVDGALHNPGQVVLLYSPPGPVVFDSNPNNKFKDIKDYTDGQLYMMYADNEKVNNVAISVSSEGESWLSQIMPSVYGEAMSKNSAIERVKYFITHPILTGKTIDQFLDDRWKFQDRILFKNKDNVEFSLSQTLALIRQSLAGQLQKSNIVNQLIQNIDIENISAHHIDQIYGALAQHYMREKGIDTLTLGGSCGGTEIKLDIFTNGLDNFSTSFRTITQGNNIFKASKDAKDDPNLCRCSSATGPHFHCPGVNKKTKEPCRHAIVVGEGTVRCPACGAGKTC